MVEICLEELVPMSVTTSEREQEPAADRFALSLWLRWPQPEQILLWHETSFRLPGDEIVATPACTPQVVPLGHYLPVLPELQWGMGGYKSGLDQEI